MTILKLMWVFAKIGLFSFGGGYAMVPMLQSEVLRNGWLTQDQLTNIIAVAEMTPGPIAVNAATFVGYNVGGITGGIAATIGVALPSMLLIFILSGFFFKYNRHPDKIMIFYGVRPVVAGLIMAAAFVIAKTALFTPETVEVFTGLFKNPVHTVSVGAVVILALALYGQLRLKLNPIVAILCGGLAGILFFYIL